MIIPVIQQFFFPLQCLCLFRKRNYGNNTFLFHFWFYTNSICYLLHSVKYIYLQQAGICSQVQDNSVDRPFQRNFSSMQEFCIGVRICFNFVVDTWTVKSYTSKGVFVQSSGLMGKILNLFMPCVRLIQNSVVVSDTRNSSLCFSIQPTGSFCLWSRSRIWLLNVSTPYHGAREGFLSGDLKSHFQWDTASV